MISVINHRNNSGITALHIACLYQNVYMVEYILKNGGDPNILTDRCESTAVFAMKKFSDKTISILKILIEYNFNICQHINQYHRCNKSTYLTLLCELCHKGNVECLKYVSDAISRKQRLSLVDFFVTDNQGRNIIEFALRNKNNDNAYQIVKYLVEEIYYAPKCEHNILSFKNQFGNTSLHIAAEADNVKAFEFLLDKGAISLHTSYNHLTMLPIHTACRCGSHNILDFILKKKLHHMNLNVQTEDKHQQDYTTALGLAVKHGSSKCVELLCGEPTVDLFDGGFHTDTLSLAFKNRNASIFNILLNEMSKRNQLDKISKGCVIQYIESIASIVGVPHADLDERTKARAQWIEIKQNLANLYSITIDEMCASNKITNTKYNARKHDQPYIHHFRLKQCFKSKRPKRSIQREIEKKTKKTIESKNNIPRCNNSHALTLEFADKQTFMSYSINEICHKCGDIICTATDDISYTNSQQGLTLLIANTFHYCQECHMAICNTCVIIQYLYKIITHSRDKIQRNMAGIQCRELSKRTAKELFDECINANIINSKLLERLCKDKKVIDFIVYSATTTTSDTLRRLIEEGSSDTCAERQRYVMSFLGVNALFMATKTFNLKFLNFLYEREFNFKKFINCKNHDCRTPLLEMCCHTRSSGSVSIFVKRFLEICNQFSDECKLDIFAKCDKSKRRIPTNVLEMAIMNDNYIIFDVLMKEIYSKNKQHVIEMFKMKREKDDDNENSCVNNGKIKTNFLLNVFKGRKKRKRVHQYVIQTFKIVLNYCVEYKFDFENVYRAGCNPIHLMCCRSCNTLELKYLKRVCDENGIVINWNGTTNSKYRATPLILAIESNRGDCITFLLNEIENIDIISIKSGPKTRQMQGNKVIYPAMNALEHACYHGWNVKMVNMLLDKLIKRKIKISVKMIDELIAVAYEGHKNSISRDWKQIDHFLRLLRNKITSNDYQGVIQLVGHLQDDVDAILDSTKRGHSEWHENQTQLLNRFENYQLTPFEKHELEICKNNEYKTIGKWYIRESLGKGAFGKVYLASHTEYGFKAALKFVQIETNLNSDEKKDGVDDSKTKWCNLSCINTASKPKNSQR